MGRYLAAHSTLLRLWPHPHPQQAYFGQASASLDSAAVPYVGRSSSPSTLCETTLEPRTQYTPSPATAQEDQLHPLGAACLLHTLNVLLWRRKSGEAEASAQVWARQLAGVTRARKLGQVACPQPQHLSMQAAEHLQLQCPTGQVPLHNQSQNNTVTTMTSIAQLIRMLGTALVGTLMTPLAGRSPKIGFEGGQTPLRQRVPKRGFRNPNALDYVPLNLTKLMRCVETKRLDSSQVAAQSR